MQALMKGRTGGITGQPTSVFSPGHRVKINIVPLFINLFLPWGIFVFCAGMTSFWVRYVHPLATFCALGIVVLVWLICILVAFWARRHEPDPTWFSYVAVIVGIMMVSGAVCGDNIYQNLSKPYYGIKDMKVVKGVDASVTPGTNVIDAGIVEFLPGNTFHEEMSWHFKSKTLYCVAPIVSNTSQVPLSQTFDFWAVGKDCCSTSSSDFRCGSWGSALAKSGLRVLSDTDIAFYRLAVQQTASLYNILAPNPIFLTWSQDPRLEVGSLNQRAFKNYCIAAAAAFVVSLFLLSMAAVRFAWLGRAESINSMAFNNAADWAEGGYAKPIDYAVKTYS